MKFVISVFLLSLLILFVYANDFSINEALKDIDIENELPSDLPIFTNHDITDEVHGKIIDDLVNWFEENGGEINNVEIRRDEETKERGIYTTKDLYDSDADTKTIMEIPSHLILSISPISKTAKEFFLKHKDGIENISDLTDEEIPNTCDLMLRWPKNEIENVLKKFPPFKSRHILLSLCLIHEVKKTKNSFWFEYIQALPRSFDLPIFWEKEQLERLQNSPIRFEIEKIKNEIKKEYEALTDLFGHPSQGFTKNTYNWASLIVQTRGINFGVDQGDDKPKKFFGLVPMFEMINFNPDITASSRGSVSMVHDFSRDTFKVDIHNDYEKDQQIYKIDQGCMSLNCLFKTYGVFPTTENERSFLPIQLFKHQKKTEGEDPLILFKNPELFSKYDSKEYKILGNELLNTKIELIKTLKLNPVRISYHFSEIIMATFRIIGASQEELKPYLENPHLPTRFISNNNEKIMIGMLKEILQGLLLSYKTTLKEDEYELEHCLFIEDQDVDFIRKIQALKIRINDKREITKILYLLKQKGETFSINTFKEENFNVVDRSIFENIEDTYKFNPHKKRKKNRKVKKEEMIENIQNANIL
eukprot:TRINITY_DN2729_c0_g1_i1.p1 TRINITY_DN2729_c0_g1~~TRINITY_DN2729_c0_g1_i1.p1  ORF type:complete len:589 (+),score=142.76 TRINITY_DN2729_c0_g1_i1:103-1869(+)